MEHRVFTGYHEGKNDTYTGKKKVCIRVDGRYGLLNNFLYNVLSEIGKVGMRPSSHEYQCDLYGAYRRILQKV